MSEPATPYQDDALVARARHGDAAALAVLYHRHAPALLRYLERRTADRALSEDVLQETFLRIFERRGRYDEKGRCRAWLFTIATRLANDRVRTTRRRKEITEAFAPDLAPRAIHDPLARVRHQEILGEIEQALCDLPPVYAATFQLRVCESFSYREIGEMLGEPEGTLRSRVHHALRRIRARLSPDDSTRDADRGRHRTAREIPSDAHDER